MSRHVRKSFLHLAPFIREGVMFRVGIPSEGLGRSHLEKIGFSWPLQIGQAVLPSPLLGRISDFNANGKMGAPKRELPKEKFLVEYVATITDWHGNPHDVHVCQERERFQRDHIAAPGEELNVLTNTNGVKQIVSKEMIFGANPELEVHIINLLLESFGEFNVYDSSANQIISAPVQRVAWKLLPSGSWSSIKGQLSSVIKTAKPNYGPVLEGRLEYLNSFNPNTVAIGIGGFSDYLAFEFPSKQICILESIRPLNATYIFKMDWKAMSQLTKTQIINQNLASQRLLHTQHWKNQVGNILK